jgi:RNA polymerase sigma-70 factor (ECF subfamily)
VNDELTALIERARNDTLPIEQQHVAFGEVVTRFEERAFGWALQLLNDPEEAKDATQDAFITAWLKLRQLRDAPAFAAWLKRLVATQCNRRRRKRRADEVPRDEELRATTQLHFEQRERQRLLAQALSRLSEAEHRIVVLFYFLGRTLGEIATILGIPPGTVGKRLYSARITIRRTLPRALRDEFLPLEPASQFLRRVREGLFDEYVGEYRFDERPEHVIRVAREGSLLVGYGGDQRNVLASISDSALVATEFDGEGRFQRDANGRIVQFIYYEFGARLGVAKRV